MIWWVLASIFGLGVVVIERMTALHRDVVALRGEVGALRKQLAESTDMLTEGIALTAQAGAARGELLAALSQKRLSGE